MRVLLVTDAYYPYPSGVSELNFNKALWLKKKDIDVDILTTSYGDEDIKYPAYRLGRVLKIPTNGSYITMTFDINLSQKVKKFLENNNYDILHLSGPFPPGIAYYALKHADNKVGIIADFQAAADYILRDHYNEANLKDKISAFSMKQFGKIFNIFYKKTYDKVDQFTAISESAKIFFNIFLDYQYKIIPVGVDTTRFTPQGKTLEKIDNKNHFSILFLGRLDKRKGLDKLLKAMPYLLKKQKNIKLFIGGKGPLMQKYKNLVKKLNIEKNIEFLGFISNNDLPALYRSADLYISPATGGEVFGIVLTEAMASGTPVIASNIPGYREVIQNDINGVLTNTKNPREFAQTIYSTITNKTLLKRISENALINTHNKYSWDIIADQMIEIFENIIKAKN